MSVSRIVQATFLFCAGTLLVAPGAEASTQSRCASEMQKEYGKYYSCALKAQSKATRLGTFADLTRCQASLDKKLSRIGAKYGDACPEADSQSLAAIADSCIDDTATVTSGGIRPVPGVPGGVVCSDNALISDMAARPKFSAKNPPPVESMSITPLGDGRGRFEVTYAETERGICLPREMELDFGDRSPVKLQSRDGSRTFTADVRLDTAEWKNFEREFAKASADSDGGTIPVFDGRVKALRGELAPAPLTLTGSGVAGVTQVLSAKPMVMPKTVDPERTLMVTDPVVVEDPARTFDPCDPVGTPMGPWTFGYLMQEMANQPATGIAPSDLVLDWLDQWTSVQSVNGLSIPPRIAMQDIIDRWLAESAAAGAPAGQLDLSIAPFRLMAIVNRVDLRENAAYGGGNCGEGRFVFGVLNVDTDAGICEPMPFTVIFEYGVNMTTCQSCKNYARRWLDLQLHPMGSPMYLSELEAITHVFTDANTNPEKPNGNSINQIRTNEIALDSPWEMREFNLEATGLLGHATTKQNVRQDFNFTMDLANWVNANAATICAGNFTVPDTVSGTPFLAAHVPYPFGAFFDGPGGAASIADRCARFQLSFNSCSGCHGGDTGTQFTHIGNSGMRPLGAPADLSAFLTGAAPPNPIADPADGTPFRTFDDLARRQMDLWAAANVPCLSTVAFQPVPSVH